MVWGIRKAGKGDAPKSTPSAQAPDSAGGQGKRLAFTDDWLINWLTDQLIDWLTNWLIDSDRVSCGPD